MARATIDYGIDLGTTNSAIAVLDGGDVEVVKNNDSLEYTPSAVWLDKGNAMVVGRAAKERLDSDEANAFSEFKLQMGREREYCFARNGQVMKPEDLSAEVLKSLLADVRRRRSEDLQAAVITVPADFDLPQTAATQRAAQLAGLTFSPLLQEPVAAAQAYGFQSQSDKVFWLVYDFGGGTFDAAVIQVRDGEIQVINHGGEIPLGGKLIDWQIVDQLLIPAVAKAHHLSDFRRGNKRWTSAIAKLKLAAEEAKIRLSRDESVEISEFLGLDDGGQPMMFEYELHRGDVEALAEPYILRTINICKRVLAEKRLGSGNIEKLLLVGGPTLMPYLRERLADPKDGLGIPLEFSIDPITVVACGAAIFAGTQRLPQEGLALASRRQEGMYTVSFPRWQFKGSENEPLTAGVVEAPAGQSLDGYAVELINVSAGLQWRSGKVGLAPNGGFMTSLWAEKGRVNIFQVELCDKSGRLCQVATDPDPLTYQVGLVITNPPLTHSVGVALVANEVEWFFEKGAPLPARKRHILRTAFEVRQGQASDVIRIPVVEGQNARADRNHRIGHLEIRAEQVRRTIPAGSEVEVTIEVDESRLVRTKAYIPILHEEFEEVMHITGGAAPKLEELQKEVAAEKERLAETRKRSQGIGDPQAQQALQRIDGERMVHDIDSALEAAPVDPDAAGECARRLLDLRVAIDQVEEALEWPSLVAQAEELITAVRDLINQHGDAEDRSASKEREASIRNAIQSRDADLLRQRTEELRSLAMRVLDRKGILPVLHYQKLAEMKEQMRDPARAQQLLAQGLQAMNSNNTQGLRAVNRQLVELLPAQARAGADASTLTRW